MGPPGPAEDDHGLPAPLRRATTAPMSRRTSSPPMPAAAKAHAESSLNAGATAAATAAMATAAAQAAAVAAAGHAGPNPSSPALATTQAPSTSTPAAEQGHTHTANGEVVETLYTHPAAKILSFSAGARNFALDAGSSSSRNRLRRSMTAITEDDIEPGTLAWSSQFERTIAVGTLCIYRAPGSVAFLSCGSALQPILPKSQSWCIDEESSKFILQIRRPQYWRIEVPVGDGGENDARAHRLREVLDHILQFEKTPCPFKRDFTVELPEQPSEPVKKRPWAPVKRPEPEPPAASSTPTTPLRPRAPTHRSPSPSSRPPQPELASPSRSPQPKHATPIPPLQLPEFTKREWATVLEGQGKAPAEEVDEFGRRIVPALVAEHERIIMEAKAGEIEVNKAGTPWRNNGSSSMSPTAGRQGETPRERALSLASEVAFFRSTWSNLDPHRWPEGGAVDSDRSTVDSSPFNSIRSWLSPGRTLPPPSPPSSTSNSVASAAHGHDADSTTTSPRQRSLYQDARRIINSGAPSTGAEQRLPIRHRATTSVVSVSTLAPLPPALSIINPHHQSRFINSGRATTQLQAMRHMPNSIMYRVLEILLAPPGYLITLMLKVAARIISGEWRGFDVGKTDRGESIPVRWDYTDVEDPLGRSAEYPPRARTKAKAKAEERMERPNGYTGADGDVYTDAEDSVASVSEIDDEDDEEEEDDDAGQEAHLFSPLARPVVASSSKAKYTAQKDEPLSDDEETVVWRHSAANR